MIASHLTLPWILFFQSLQICTGISSLKNVHINDLTIQEAVSPIYCHKMTDRLLKAVAMVKNSGVEKNDICRKMS
jgi:hypothetical protein